MIYLDPLAKNGMVYHGRSVKTSHMYSDKGTGELLNLAEEIGLKAKWIHNSRGFFHFDIMPGKRKIAIEKGAKELTRKESVYLIRELRKNEK
ncbi:DUF4031 domain-containing protein [Candidatus Pacearchaeota archaeon]|nr:DUF4031 domain-containing protein [Candidatus Pacearchaeota archaeon]